MNPYSEFTCLYTSQKLKKAKTWHDGHLRHFHNNSKVVLYDTKFGVLDSTFRRGVAIAVGDDMDMDKHLVTVEDLTVAYATNSGDQRQISHSTPTPAPATLVRRTPAPLHRSVATKTSIMATSSAVSTMRSTALSSPSNNAKHPANGSASSSSELVNQTTLQQGNDGESVSLVTIPQETKRKKWRSPFTNTAPPTASSWSSSGGDWESIDYQEIQEAFPSTMDEEEELRHTVTETDNALSKAVSSARITTTNTTATLATATTTARPAPKRRKVGLSRVPNAISSSIQLTMGSPHRPPSTQLEFPNAARCTNFTGKNSNQLLRRSLALGARFMSTNQYKDGMSFLIYEHLQLVVIESAIAMWSMKTNANMSEGESLDAQYRSRGIHMHSGSTLRRRGDAYPGFPVYSERSFKGADPPGASVALVQPATQQGATLSVTNKEHHSKYSKDDLWVVSTTLRFDTASTFFARSIFYGPSGSDVELLCLSQKDSNAARNILANGNQVCAIRLFNAMSEFMMLDNLSENLTRTPLLPALLNYVPPELVKASKASIFKAPSRIPEKSGCIVLTDEDGIEVELEIREAIAQYRLNEEQATVLRNFAQAVIRAPGWVQKSSDSSSVLLVHGVFGAGKSFLIAVLIVFIDNIINKARPLPREERSCRFLVASMTNVAVDRILTALLDLNYDKFVRVGSLKKVARRVLPYTAQSTSNRQAEEIKELQSILDDDSLSIKERQYVREAMRKFQKQENRGIVEGANVVGATCIASTFEVLDNISFPIVILDEASQLLEAMSLIPICRAAAEKLIMVGDPLQLSPPISTSEDKCNAGKGLSRTLFDRSVEMGLKPVMLRTQYRCHHRIAEISNALFYSNVLRTGPNPDERAPLIEGLPTLTFVDNAGQEILNTRTKSYTNAAEIKLVVTVIKKLLDLNIPESDIGVISLYKSQADAIQAELGEQLKGSGMKGGVQISTVDAFQGSEKDVIIVSTVRTDSIGFIDNRQRVNVALTRSKRHLFIVGNSRLLSSNSIWGPIIKDHCSKFADGFMSGDQFMPRLRALKPLVRQVDIEPPHLLESEDEDDHEDGHTDKDASDYDYDEPDYAAHDHDSESASEPAVQPAARRTYMLYEADEENDEESDDASEIVPESRTHYASRSNSSSARKYYGEVVNFSNAYSHSEVMGQAIDSTEAALGHVTDSSSPGTRRDFARVAPHSNTASAIARARYANSRRLDFIPAQQEPSRHSSQENVPRQTDTPRVDLSSKRSLVEEEQQLGRKPVKDEPMHSTEGPTEDEEEVVWEMGEEEEEVNEAPKSALFENSVERSTQPKFNEGLQSQHTDGSQDGQKRFSAAYESQRIEDLDVGGWSQLVGSGMVGSLGMTRESTTDRKAGVFQQDDDEDGDLSCLEVGDLDML